MAVGTKAGFFGEKKPAAVLKHKLLAAYLKPFAMKVGQYSAGHRIVYLDGYAGAGRYDDGSTTSPLLALNTAKGVMSSRRHLECLFVERDKHNYDSLRLLVESYQKQGVACEAYPGDVAAHLTTLLDRAKGVPLFLFLDPCGVGLPYDRLVHLLAAERSHQRPGTEVLLNFSDEAVRRVGGHLTSLSGSEKALATMDANCGGDWWREIYLDSPDNATATERIAKGFVDRISADGKGQGWAAAARNRADHQAKYHLVFFTRHLDGAWLFGDSLASAQKEWRRTQSPPPDFDDGALIQLEDTFPAEEEKRERNNIATIKDNLLDTRAKYGPFGIGARWREVYGDVYGLANESQVRKAVKELHADGYTTSTGVGGRLKDQYFAAAPQAALPG